MADFRFRRLDGTIAGEDPQATERPHVMSDETLPPVGATVTDGDGVTWTCAMSMWTTDGFTRERLWKSTTGIARLVEHAKDTTALWRLQQERDDLQQEVSDTTSHLDQAMKRLIELERELAAFRALAAEARGTEARLVAQVSIAACLKTQRRIWDELAALASKEASDAK